MVIGVVDSAPRRIFIRLARVTLDARALGRAIVIALGVLAAGVVVFLSWQVPEPESRGTDPARSVENVSHLQCARQQAPLPNYGARSLGNECVR